MEFFISLLEKFGAGLDMFNRNFGHISCRSILTGLAFSVLLSTVIYREYSWSNSNLVLKNRLAEREKDIDSLKLQVLIDEFSDTRRNACLLGSGECTNEDNVFERAIAGDSQNGGTDEFSVSSFRERLSNIVSSTSEALNLKVVDLEVLMKPKILDRVGFQTIFLCVLVFVNDRYRTHSSTVFPTSTPLRGNAGMDTETDNSIHRQWTMANRYFESHITRRKIVCEGVLYLAVGVLATMSRFNIIEMGLVVPFILKFLLLWFISNYVFSFFYNVQRLYKYMPQDRVELWKSLCQPSWWGWAIPRIITSDGFRFANSAAQTNGMIEALTCQAVVLFGELFYYYPFYYFYFYNDYFYGKNTVSEFTEFTRRRNIFLLNMLLHGALINLLSSVFVIVALGTPKWCRKAIGYLVDFNSPLLHPWLMTLVRFNGYICYIRIIWYFFTGNSTYYTTIVLLCLAQGLTSAGNTCTSNISVLSYKEQTRAYLMEPFVRSFIGNHILKNAKYYEREDCEYKTEQEVVDAVSVLFVDLYEALLDKTGTVQYVRTCYPSRYTVLLFYTLHDIVWYRTALYCTTLNYTSLHHTILY